MNHRFAIFGLALGFSVCANADIWTWKDPQGATHYVSSNAPIWVWVDETNLVHYSDKPEHEDAQRVELAWYSDGDLPAEERIHSENSAAPGRELNPNETDEERHEREAAEAYYCREARKIYDTYLHAPQLFRTNEDGEREYLSAEEMAATLEETRLRVEELCG